MEFLWGQEQTKMSKLRFSLEIVFLVYLLNLGRKVIFSVWRWLGMVVALGRRRDKVRSSRLSSSALKVSCVQKKNAGRQESKREGGKERKRKKKYCFMSSFFYRCLRKKLRKVRQNPTSTNWLSSISRNCWGLLKGHPWWREANGLRLDATCRKPCLYWGKEHPRWYPILGDSSCVHSWSLLQYGRKNTWRTPWVLTFSPDYYWSFMCNCDFILFSSSMETIVKKCFGVLNF